MMVKNDIMESINQLKNENQEKQRAKTKLDEMMDEYEKSPYKVEQPTKWDIENLKELRKKARS